MSSMSQEPSNLFYEHVSAFFALDSELNEDAKAHEKYLAKLCVLLSIQLRSTKLTGTNINDLIWKRAVDHCYIGLVNGEQERGCIGFPTMLSNGGRCITVYEDAASHTELALNLLQFIRSHALKVMKKVEEEKAHEKFRKFILSIAFAVVPVPQSLPEQNEFIDNIYDGLFCMALRAKDLENNVNILKKVFLRQASVPSIQQVLKRFLNLPSDVSDDRSITFQNGILFWTVDGKSKFYPTPWSWRINGGVITPYEESFDVCLHNQEELNAVIQQKLSELPLTHKLLSGAYPDGVVTWLPWLAMTGYLCTPKNPLRKIFVINGKSSSGKSVITSLWQSILGNKAISSEFDAFVSRHGKAKESLGKYAVFFPETGETLSKDSRKNKRGAWEFLKQWSGGDQVTLGELYKQDVVAVMHSKPVFISNEFPHFGDDDSGALEERLVVFNHLHTVPRESRISNFAAAILNEEGSKLVTLAASLCASQWHNLSKLWQEDVQGSASLSTGLEQIRDSISFSTSIALKRLLYPTSFTYKGMILPLPVEAIWQAIFLLSDKVELKDYRPKRFNKYPLEFIKELRSMDLTFNDSRVIDVPKIGERTGFVNLSFNLKALQDMGISLEEITDNFKAANPNSSDVVDYLNRLGKAMQLS